MRSSAEMAVHRERYRRVAVATAFFAGSTVLAVSVFHITWRAPGSRLIGSCCDQPSTVNLLRWTGFAVTHGHNPFVMHYLHAPVGINLMWQPNGMPLLGLLATPAEWLFGPVVTYNLLVTLALPLSGLAAYVALRRWVGGYGGPMVGGLLYGFSPFMMTHALGHLNILFVPVPPLLLLCLSDLVAYRRWRWWVSGLAIGGLGAAQFLLSPEVLVGTAMAAVLMIAVLAMGHLRDAAVQWKRVAAGVGVALTSMLVIIAWPLVEMLAGPYRLHGRFEPVPFSTDVVNLVLPSVTGQFAPEGARYFTTWHWSLGEAAGYLGVTLILLCVVVAARNWRADVVRVAGVTGAVMLVLSLGPSVTVAGVDLHVWLPSRILLALPFLENMLPGRLFVFVDLAAAVLVATFVRSAVAGTPTRRPWRMVGTGVVVLVAVVPLTPALHYPATVYALPPFFTTAAVDTIPESSNTLVVPYPEGGPADGAPMIWQAQANFRYRMVGGYVFVPTPSGASGAYYGGPPTTVTTTLAAIVAGQPAPQLTPALVASMRGDLASYGLGAVVVGPMIGADQAIRLLTQLIGRPPRYVGGVALWVGGIPGAGRGGSATAAAAR